MVIISERLTPAAESTEAPAQSGRDWPLVRGDALATGVAQTTLPDSPGLLWKFAIPKGRFTTTPIIVHGVIYLGELDGPFRAIDLANGHELWNFPSQVGFTATAAMRDGRLYVGDSDGIFHCLDAKDGKQLWKFESKAEIDSSANFYHDCVLFGSQDSTLYCLRADTGQLVWKHAIADQIRCSPTVVEDRAFIAGCDARLHIIDLHNGQETGFVDIDAPTGSTPAVRGDIVYFGTEGGTFYAVDWKQAKEVWKFQDLAHTEPFRSSAALVPEAVIFGSNDKRVRALDPATKKTLWTFVARGRIEGSPVVVGSRVYFGATDGRLYGLDRATGKKQWEYEAGGEFIGSAAVAAQRLVIASDAGIVYCFGAK